MKKPEGHNQGWGEVGGRDSAGKAGSVSRMSDLGMYNQ